jgi:hypothetical protein
LEREQPRPAGYRWGVAVVPDTPGPTVFAVGPTGTDYSIDRGKNWEQMNEEYSNAIGFAGANRGWAGYVLTGKQEVNRITSRLPTRTKPLARKLHASL